MYERVPGLPVPEETLLIGFANDLGVMVVARHPKHVEVYKSKAIYAIIPWLHTVEWDLADEETEVAFITNCKKRVLLKSELENTRSFQYRLLESCE